VSHTVHIPTPLRQYTDKLDTVQVGGATVGELLTQLTTIYPELKKHLYNEQGKLRHFVNIYVNDEDIRYLQKEETALGEKETISIIPSVAGGSDAAVATPLPTLEQEEVARYSRHLILPEVGLEGQRKLKAASVLCVGAGGLGSPVLLYLAAAGIGRIGIVDFDVVDLSNLQRQVLHGTSDIGRKKLDSARDSVKAINPHVQVDLHETALTSQNALELFKPYDIIIDGTDNFPTRYLVNDACVLLGKPNAYGSIFRFEGQASVFATKGGPCYRCLYPEPPPPGLVPSCAEGGVLGVLPGIIGVIQATEAIKVILGTGEPLIGRFLIYDALRMKFRELKLRRDPECPVCGDNPTVKALIDYEQFCGLKPAPGAAPAAGTGVPEVTVEELKARIDRGDDFDILDVREPHEVDIVRIEGTTVIPLGELPNRLEELDRSRDLVVHCKMGGRSAKAVAILREKGFDRAVNLAGGILAWVDRIEPHKNKY
jgi:molybdopterin/thiamine biosynthesis adenylyltransferase/rhodanese-related sulfurtransferase/molybdopterin converting factor small subunit